MFQRRGSRVSLYAKCCRPLHAATADAGHQLWQSPLLPDTTVVTSIDYHRDCRFQPPPLLLVSVATTGIGLLYSELVQGIPPIFRQFIDKIPSIHSVFVFVSVKHIPISKVEPHERFLFRQLEPREFRLFKCVVRYGYRDAKETAMDFEKSLIKQLKEFVYHEFFIREGNQPFPNCQLEEPGTETAETNRRIARMAPDETLKPQGSAGSDSSGSILPANSNRSGNSSRIRAAALIPAIEEEKQFIQKEMEKGVVYLLGETEMVAKPSSSIIKRAVVNNMYQFIKRNFRQGDEAMSIPKSRLLKVGVTYEI